MVSETTEVVGDGTRVTSLKYKDRNTDEIKEIELSGIFVQIGLVPNTEWLKDSEVALSERGEIEVRLTNLALIATYGNARLDSLYVLLLHLLYGNR